MNFSPLSAETEAVKQQKANKAKNCGLKGGAWSEDYAAHFGWCLKASSSQRAGANNSRNEQLAGCFSVKSAAEDQALKDACAQYAATATTQQKENLDRKCNFAGGAWNKDWNVHFKWCMAGHIKKAPQQSAARHAALGNDCMKLVCTTTDSVIPYPPFVQTTTKCRKVPK